MTLIFYCFVLCFILSCHSLWCWLHSADGLSDALEKQVSCFSGAYVDSWGWWCLRMGKGPVFYRAAWQEEALPTGHALSLHSLSSCSQPECFWSEHCWEWGSALPLRAIVSHKSQTRVTCLATPAYCNSTDPTSPPPPQGFSCLPTGPGSRED